MKKSLALIMAALMLFALLSACGTPAVSPTPSTAASPSPTAASPSPTATTADTSSPASPSPAVAWDTTKQDTIILSVMNNYYTAGWNEMAKEYMALHPETKVVVDVVADNDALSTKISTWKAADDLSNAADIIHVNYWTPTAADYQNGRIYDFTQMLDEPNPYNGGQPVRACLDPGALQTVALMTPGIGLEALPFDRVAIGVFYNKDLLDAKGLPVPTTYEQWQDDCAKLRADGMATPIAADATADWLVTSLADAALRDTALSQILIQPSDYLYNAATMSANDNFKFDESNLLCDQNVAVSPERIDMYLNTNKFVDPTTVEVWNQFAKIGQYFTPNFFQAQSTDVLTSFEKQNCAFMVSGSWNVGSLSSDMAQLGSAGFTWGSMSFPSFQNPPAGWAAQLRTLNTVGNVMGIVMTHGTGDHLERVKDFYKFVYSPSGAQTMFTTTLDAGNLVQGPPAITGVTLPQNLTDELNGFVTTGSCNTSLGTLAAHAYYNDSDKNIFDDNLNQLLSGKIDATTFCTTMAPYYMQSLQEDIQTNNYDLNPANPKTPNS